MLKTKTITRLCGISVLVGIIFLLCYPALLSAAGPTRMKMKTTEPELVTLTMGKSLILESPDAVKRVALSQPTIADAMVLSPRQIYLSAKTPGMTSLTVWGAGDIVYAVFDVEVVPDVNRVKERLHKMLPGEKNIIVSASHDHLTVSGSVSSAAIATQVTELARAYAPGDKEGASKLINLLEVGGVQQVMLEIKVSEMTRSVGRQLGVRFDALGRSGGEGNISFLNNFPMQVTGTSFGGIVAQYIRGDVTWDLLITALKENGLIKILAEPTLLTLSGKEARFLAGGEFPVPVPQGGTIGTTLVTIQYKPFGVGLAFTPIVLNNGKISMQVAPEVSELDFENAIELQGFRIPSITTRRVSTTIELGDGQSFAIAGLIKEEMRETIRKFPLLGDVPVLGALFRSSSYQKRDTELVVIVTPHLVKPLDMKKQTLPTDQFVDPNDFEFYLLGHAEGRGEPGSAGVPTQPAEQAAEKLEGKFGHMTPQQ